MRKHAPLGLQRLPRRAAFILCVCLLLLVVAPGMTISMKEKKEAATPKGSDRTETAVAQPSSKAVPTAQQGLAQWATQGKFSAPITWPLEMPLMVHAAMLPDGRILFWGRTKEGEAAGNPTIYDLVGNSPARIWNPATDGSQPSHFEAVNNVSTNLFCSGHSLMPDGRLFVAGGHAHRHPNSISGDKHTNIFDPVSRLWAPQDVAGSPPVMEKGRWYPFTLVLENGKIAILSGTYNEPPSEDFAAAIKQWNPEIYDPQTNSLEVKNPLTDLESELPNYPYLFLDPIAPGTPGYSPHRGVFVAGPNYSFFWNPNGGSNGKGSRSPVSLHNEKHTDGSAVMFNAEEGKILLTGGRTWASGGPVTKVAKTINLSDVDPQWVATQSMIYPRTFHTSTVLPDGKVLVTGGVPCRGGHTHDPCNGAVPIESTLLAEMWDPATGAWSAMATGSVKRAYHSTALLLPDATVLVNGGGLPDGRYGNEDPLSERRHTFKERRMEIYSPPYLFDDAGNPASRPSLDTAPAQVALGQQFNLTFSNAAAINRVALIRLPSVTHGFNSDQRRNVLSFSTTSTPGQLSVTAPSEARKCPPGYYMLFIMEERGTAPNIKLAPSQAKIIRIVPTPPIPALSINNVAQFEGNAGSANFNFTVSLSSPAPVGGVSFNIATANGSATAADGDFVAKSLAGQTIPQGSSTYTFSVQVNGDTNIEPTENFSVNVTNVIGAAVADGQGQGMIINDEATPSPPSLVWVDDAAPAGAVVGGDGEGWNWISSNPGPVSGGVSHQSNVASGIHQHYFYNATQTLPVSSGDSLFAYVYLDPANPPLEIMLQWNEPVTGWEHRAYWGWNVIRWGSDTTISRRYMGPLPPVGQWIRLEVPASSVGLEGRTLNGMAFTLYNGRAAWDYAGVTNKLPHTVWVDDALPAGAVPYADADSWNWVNSNPLPASGALSHQSNVAPGIHQHYFVWATTPLQVNTGDKLVAYVYLDPANPPLEMMLQWYEPVTGWEHRAYWGWNVIHWGSDTTITRRYMGPLPPVGQWIRLEVPASHVGVGLEGRTVSGMAFTLYNGRAAWDYVGKTGP